MKESFKRKLLKWAGHVVRMEGKRLTKRADAHSRRRRGRPRLRWEDSVKRDLAAVGGEGRMRGREGGVETGVGDGSEMGSVTKKVKKINWYRCQPYPRLQG